MKRLFLVVSVVPALLLVGSGPLRADDPPEARFAAMSPDEVRAYERETLRRVADLALIPPVPNTEPLPQYDYDKLDYGMTIGIERTPKGRLWACWVAGGDSPKAFFVLATSDDDGETWSKPRLVLDSHSRSLPRDRSILVGNLWTDPLGRLWLFFDQSMEMFDGRGGVWATVCENPDAEMPAWSAPRRIWHGVMLNKPTVLSTGEWMLPLSLDQRDGTHPAERGMFGPFQGLFPELDPLRGANVFVSTDEGATWQWRGGVAFPNPDWHEHMIVERRDNSLWMLARTAKGIMQSTSTDGGRTWAKPTEPPGIRQPNARFHIRRLASGKLLLVKHGDRIDAHEGRVKLSAWLSDDDGATWQGGLVLDERPGISYPDGFQATDGTIFISYDRNRSTDGEILLARFTEADVLARQLTAPKSKLKMLISRPLAPRPTARAVDAATILPAGWNPKAAADAVLAGLVRISAPQVKGAHDAEFVCVGDRAYVVEHDNDVEPGHGAGKAMYCVLTVVDLKTLAVEKTHLLAKAGQTFANTTLPDAEIFVPRIIRKDEHTLRCWFCSQPAAEQAVTWYRDFDLRTQAFAGSIHKAKLKTAAGTFDMEPRHFHADAVTQGFAKPPVRNGLYIFDSFKEFNGRRYVALNNFEGKQNALAVLVDDFTTFEVIGHYNEPQAERLSESAVNRLPDGTWIAICRNDKGNYHFTTSRDGRIWTVGEPRPFVPNGLNSKPTFERFGGVYHLGWQENTKVGDCNRSVFNVDVSRDGKAWERKYRFESPHSFQYPTFHEHDGTIWLAVTQSDHKGSSDRIMFGRLEGPGYPP
jgi:sialidase-1